VEENVVAAADNYGWTTRRSIIIFIELGMKIHIYYALPIELNAVLLN